MRWWLPLFAIAACSKSQPKVLATIDGDVTSIAVDDTYVYASPMVLGKASVVRVPKTGGTAETIIAKTNAARGLTVDGGKLYWGETATEDPIDAACKRLALGDKHPDILHALDDLKSYTGNTKQTVTQLKKDYNVWLADARKLREMTVQDHEAIREVMCRTGGEYDMAQKVDELADRWASHSGHE